MGLVALSLIVGPFVEEDEGESDTTSTDGPTTTERPTTTEEQHATERESTTTTERQTTTTEAPTTTVPPTTTTTEEPEVSNDRRSAQSYLDLMGFSRTGLIKQLEFEGYPTAAATTAIDSLDVDWNAEAVESAQSYTELMGFSRSGLVDQLVFEGFTQAEAEHGAAAVFG